MAGRKRHSAEDIVRKLRRADELAAEGKTGEEIAADLNVSAATLYNWRRTWIRDRGPVSMYDDEQCRG
jgi:putative transposase